METQHARRAKKALDLPHVMIYFAPELEREMSELGIDSWSRAYFASRAAPLGTVGANVVAATFYNFNPELVRQHIPAAWSLASPDDIIAARFRAVSGALERMLGPETLRSHAVEEAGRLAAKAAEKCSPAGKPLFAGHAEIEYPDEPHLRLWHALTLLRDSGATRTSQYCNRRGSARCRPSCCRARPAAG
ncbi:SCO6745 family protein [Actinopolyspora sp. H202]|uniref:SCO6745 family protein n=1 Tax=Actinopolyspora sp. H202 TaxID=1500456 RepID=UPI003EE60FEB